MYCSGCGFALATDAQFCTRCGRPHTSARTANDHPRVTEIEIVVPQRTADLLRSGRDREAVIEVVVPGNTRSFRPEGVGMGSPRLVTAADRHAPPTRGRLSSAFVMVVIVVGLVVWASNLSTSKPATTASTTASTTATLGARVSPSPVPDAAKAEAVALLGKAVYNVEEGNLGQAIDRARQAQAIWPDYPDASTFLTDIAPKATATAVVMQARATAAAVAPSGSAAGLLSERDATARALPSVVHVQTNNSVGTGFVVRDNLIATNAHVVKTSATAEVRTQDGRSLQGTIVATDVRQDIALIRVTNSKLPLLGLANSKALKPGDTLLAIGYALDLRGGPTITRGLYSTHRVLQRVTYVQTDAPLNPGNSGGPLISLRGEVVGMNTMGQRTDAGDVAGIYFAVAIEAIQVAVNAIPR